MRIIGILPDIGQAKRFSQFLRKKGIENTCEITLDKAKKEPLSSIWVHEEDQVQEALRLFEEFQKTPQDRKYDIPLKETLHTEGAIHAIENLTPFRKEITVKRTGFVITYCIIFLCTFVFMIDSFQDVSLSKISPLAPILIRTPIQNALLFDNPIPASEYLSVLKKYPIAAKEDEKEIPQEIKEVMREVNKFPYFRGLYAYTLAFLKHKSLPTGPLFVKIRQGQVWRVFTPVLLHYDILHILFNMLWVWVLGKQIEFRVSKGKYISMILIIGILSNLFQYLMSGPYFLGFSAIAVGMAGFIWMRQKVAPWEGYPLHRSVLLFLAIFVIAMSVLQMVSFAIILFNWGAFTLPIANSAHIAGGLIGMLLGRLPFFAWRAHEH